MRGIGKNVGVAILIVGVFIAGFFIFYERESAQFSPQACDGGDSQIILRLSAETNAHAELYNQQNYDFRVCFDDYFDGPGDGDHEGNLVLKLSDTTNAHASDPLINDYFTLVQYGDLTCRLIGSGNACGNNEAAIVYLSDQTNAHVSLPGSSNYPWKLCCSSASRNPKETHLECQNLQCVEVSGGGPNQDGCNVEGEECGGGEPTCGDNICELGEQCQEDCDPEPHCSDGVDNDEDELVDGDDPDCQGEDFCSDYAPYTSSYPQEDAACPGGNALLVENCGDYNQFTREYNVDCIDYNGGLAEFKEKACKRDCANVGGDDVCDWDDEDGCFLSTGEGGDLQCKLIYENPTICGPDDKVRKITIRAVKISGEGECDAGCGPGIPVCEKEVPCARVIELPFFSLFNFIFGLIAISWIYFFYLKVLRKK